MSKFRCMRYLDGVELKVTSNILINHYYTGWYKYLDEDGILRRCRYEELLDLRDTLSNVSCGTVYRLDGSTFTYIHTKLPGGCALFDPVGINKTQRNGLLDNMIISKLKVGEHVSKIHEYARSTHINEYRYHELDRLFQSVSRPVFIKSGKYFEYIKIWVGCCDSVTIDDIKKHKKYIDQVVISKLETNRQFLKYNVPIQLLSISNIILTHDKRLEYTFEFKSELRHAIESIQ